MRKIKLDVETLNVVSFETGARQDEAGTVQAHAAPTYNGGCTSEIDRCPSARGCTVIGCIVV